MQEFNYIFLKLFSRQLQITPLHYEFPDIFSGHKIPNKQKYYQLDPDGILC